MIGVSFTGHDGRKSTFSMQGAEDAASRMAALTGGSLREAMNDSQGLVRAARVPGRQTPQAAPQQRKTYVLPGGSVVRSNEGALCLRGEELNPLVPGTKVFGANGGDKGFFTFDEIDPPVYGSVVGRGVGDESQSFDANDAVRERPDGTAWATRYLTEEKWDQDKVTGLITVYKYFRLKYYSALGRAIGCSKEWREVAFSFLPGAGGGKWEVRPVFAGGVLSSLSFGSASSLSVDDFKNADGVQTVETCQCPNA